MRFSEFENIMFEMGATNLADIARKLNSTPQSVSNWKSRDQVPSHILIKVNQLSSSGKLDNLQSQNPVSATNLDMISLPDVLEKITNQFKLIFLVTFFSAFSSFINTKFIQKPIYYSEAKVLIPDQKSSNGFGGLIGVASQFGVNIPSGQENKDLSSPSLYPELLHTRVFGEMILAKSFYSSKYEKDMKLSLIINENNSETDEDLQYSLDLLRNMLSFNKTPGSPLSIIRVESFEPQLSKEIADEILIELEALSRRYKSKSVNEKINFIEDRIKSVKKDLNESELALKGFNEQNRQINSPSLKLEQDRLTRELEIHRGIYLTLKQQLELSKIEEVQEKSIFQIVDTPQESFSPINKNVKANLAISSFVGLVLGVILGLIRDFLKNSNFETRKKVRKSKLILRKKIRDIFVDYRMNGIIALSLLIAMPIVLSHQSQNPVYFNMFSLKFLTFNIFYISSFAFFLFLYFKNKK